jgi:putative endonuclease
MMHFVYLLQSSKNKSLYIGVTSDLERRLSQHNNGDSIYTKKYMPWMLIYFEGYRSKVDAYSREKALKLHAQGLRRLKERLCDSLQA